MLNCQQWKHGFSDWLDIKQIRKVLFTPPYPRLCPIHTTFPAFPLHPTWEFPWTWGRSMAISKLTGALRLSLSLSSLAPNVSDYQNWVTCRILCKSVCGSVFMVMTEWLTNPKYECFHTRKQRRICLSLHLLWRLFLSSIKSKLAVPGLFSSKQVVPAIALKFYKSKVVYFPIACKLRCLPCPARQEPSWEPNKHIKK